MKKFWRSSVMTTLLFVMAVVLLFAGTVGGAQAAISRQSAIYDARLSMRNIGVTLVETYTSGDQDISWRYYDKFVDPKGVGSVEGQNTGATGIWNMNTGYLIQKMVEESGDPGFKIGKDYPFVLKVRNSGQIDEYVRVTIYKYFVDANGEKITGDKYGWFDGEGSKLMGLSPSYITIGTPAGSGWVKDTDVTTNTEERSVYYYQGILAEGATSPAFTSTLRVNSDITKAVSVAEDIGLVVEVVVDAVQTNNATQAIASAWGTNPAKLG